MMTKKPYSIFCVAIIIAFAVAIICAALCAITVERHSVEKKIFNDLSYLDALSDFEYTLLSSSDKNLDGLEPLKSKNATIYFEGTAFLLHAYEFKNNEDAFEYFKRCSGQSNAKQELCFYFQKTTLLGTDFVAYYENYAYRVQGGNFANYANFINLLSKDFPIDICEEYHREYGIKLR